MLCPNCPCTKARVEETRDAGETVFRVRRCPECGWRVTTEEKYAENQSIPWHIRKPKLKSKLEERTEA